VGGIRGSDGAELDVLFEPVSGHVAGDGVDHRQDAVPHRVEVGIADQAVHGVAHDQRRLGGVEHDDRLGPVRVADDFQCTGGGFGELVDVGPGAGAGRLRGDRRDDLGVAHRGHRAHRRDDRDGRLTTAGDHVDVVAVAVLVEVDRRHHERPQRGRGEVDQHLAMRC